ncbi:conserved hypothetical protein [Talaromyces marneffei ATCC 18224]|uniref:Tachykinin family protein n=1 Tax=Talaromyces marneffei (strain ATCC 18224 / CBS 334.59 / QM 7333) TaxID=441960 RepID=B6QCW3_TALMQ|nr:conserved hypothetical protein [Talaromyces marneffei ATCC 18224]
MPFEFIDNNARIDRKTRKRIRSLVATGKNAGKTVVRPSRIKAFKEQSKYPTIFSSVPGSTDLKQQESSSPNETASICEIERPIGDDVFFVFTPNQLNPTSRYLAKRDCLAEQPNPSRDAIHHLCHTFRLVNKKLSESKHASMSTIATVLMLAQYERHQSEQYQGLVHLNGLQRLIGARGGALQLQKEMPIVMQKAFRVDLDFALYMGTTTTFNVSSVLTSRMIIFGTKIDHLENLTANVVSLPGLSNQLGIELHNALLEATALAGQLNDAVASSTSKVNLYTFNANIILLGYRIISISSLSQSHQLTRIENAIHLGLSIFVTTFMNGLDRKIPRMPFMSELLRALIKFGLQDDHSILLWLLFLGNATVLDPSDHDWLAPMVAITALELGLHSWGEILKMLVGLPWVNTLYNRSGQSLWLKVSTYYASPFAESATSSSDIPMEIVTFGGSTGLML